MTAESFEHTGGCLCGGVRYAVKGPLRAVHACHCSQCRRTSGHYAAFTRAPAENIQLQASESLTWFRSSKGAERGFCRICGGNLFWRQLDSNATCISAGSLDTPTGIKLDQHIFVADRGDYYTLDDHLPKAAAWAAG
jgi:hypothetical protein